MKAEPKSRQSGIKGIPKKVDLLSVENAAIERAGKAISNISGFLERWNNARQKPEGMLPQVMRMRVFRDALLAWQKEAARQKGRGNDGAREQRLRQFVVLCESFS